ncbi:MAG: hypothetical protein AAF697_07695 [Pseudomonadota bacterium]
MTKAPAIRSHSAIKVVLLASAAMMLQGCVAAVVPLAATGLLGGAAPAYDPNKGREDAARPVDGTVRVLTSQEQLGEQAAAPSPEAEALAEAATLVEAPDALAGTPGLGEEAMVELAPPPEAAPALASPVAVQLPADATQPATEPVNEGPAFTIDETDREPIASAVVPEVLEGVSAPTELAGAEITPEPGSLSPDELDGSQSREAEVSAAILEPEANLALEVPEGPIESPAESATRSDFDAAFAAADPIEEPSQLAPNAEAIAVGQAVETTAIANVSPPTLPSSVEPAQATSVQLIEVDRSVSFEGSSIDASSVSAADAAAALTTLSAAEEPAVATANLARTAPLSSGSVPTAPVEDAVAEPVPAPATIVAENVATSPAIEPPSASLDRSPAISAQAPSPNAITSLLSYANQRKFVSGEDRGSAMLADRYSLTAERAQCGGVQPTVLIDLDPEGDLFSPRGQAIPPSGLGIGLAQLRASGVRIAWISGNPASMEDDIRFALLRSTLDITGVDDVLLIRNGDDRKQTLREQLAQTRCLIAIAGDERSDFDELYEYLLDPNEARSLDVLFGEGWFLIPQPLVMESTNP